MADYWKGGSSSQGYPQVAHPAGSFGSDGGGSGGFYPRVAQPVGGQPRAPPPVPSPQQGGGPLIRVAINPAYRVAPSAQLSPQLGEVPHTSLQFDFELERRVVGEAEQESRGEGRDPVLHNGPHARGYTPPGGREEGAVGKYLAMGLQQEAVVLALATHGDVQPKVLEFCSSYELLREMGFAPEAISGALAMYDNDRERALAHLAP